MVLVVVKSLKSQKVHVYKLLYLQIILKSLQGFQNQGMNTV